ncbi:hypothetical protein B0F90DRAFT_1810134 [Multifurca ochricompacta]|uniref:Uncharacterized protein n=1 Tax=Multifurca ochricompacta TaxID=376703 RepID=A0AAD4M4Z4_9AGAM|nr:hypothetical protein B0F90DRAFT_1810134 [Multifurca ochricompacta]
MSRGGRFASGANNPPPMGLTFADIQSMSREQSALYPVCTFSPIIPASVLACEGECIVGITRAWLGNYTLPIDSVFHRIAQEISQKLLPPERHDDSMSYLRPILAAYNDKSYDGMKTAIFPSHFHGKCQRNGVDPPGCPNPDCPVVCGTPGSLVHFYPTLRLIAFNYTRSTLQRLCSPGNDAYMKAERAVARAATTPRKRESEPGRVSWFGHFGHREDKVNKGFRVIMGQVSTLLEQACGGYPSEEVNALAGCSWEEAMKAFILTFP